MKKSIVVFLTFFLVTSWLFGTGNAEKEQVLVFGRSGDSVGLDPARESDGESFIVTAEIAEQLVTFKPGTTEVIPSLAESWDISNDGLTYTFNLRKGVKFHDGTDFNAEAVVINYMRQHDKNNKYFEYGPYKYWGWMGLADIVTSIRAIDEYTVEFTLSKPFSPFLATMGMSFAAILSPSAMEEYKSDLTNNPVGTGPFKFVSWVKGDTVTIEKNNDYWGDPAKLDRVIFKVIPEPTARALALEKGEIDIFEYPSPQDLPKLESDSNISLFREPGLNVGYMAFNTQKEPFNDVRVRRAFAHAINKQEIIDAVYGELGQIAYTAIPPTMWSYTEDLKKYDYDPDKARELLAEAGYPDGFEFSMWPIPVTRPYMPNGARVAEIIQAQLAQVGLVANIEMLDWGAHLDETDNGNHEVAFLGWTGDNGDPDNFLATLLSGHNAVAPASNIAFWNNREFTDLTDQASLISDQELRIPLYKRAQEIFADQEPWVPIAHSVRVMPMRSYVKGYQGTPVGELNNLQLVYIEE